MTDKILLQQAVEKTASQWLYVELAGPGRSFAHPASLKLSSDQQKGSDFPVISRSVVSNSMHTDYSGIKSYGALIKRG